MPILAARSKIYNAAWIIVSVIPPAKKVTHVSPETAAKMKDVWMVYRDGNYLFPVTAVEIEQKRLLNVLLVQEYAASVTEDILPLWVNVMYEYRVVTGKEKEWRKSKNIKMLNAWHKYHAQERHLNQCYEAAAACDTKKLQQHLSRNSDACSLDAALQGIRESRDGISMTQLHKTQRVIETVKQKNTKKEPEPCCSYSCCILC